MRCFVAIDINDELKERISSLQSRFRDPSIGNAVKLVEKENLHITLKFLGEVSEDKITDIVKSLGNIKFQKFEIDVSDLGVFPNFNYIRVVWLDAKSSGNLENLAELVDFQLNEFPKEKFSSHLTIARVKFKSESLRDLILTNKDVYIGKQVVDRFSLKKSMLTSRGPIYEDVKIFELE